MLITFRETTLGKDPAIAIEYDVHPVVTMSTAKILSKLNLKGSGSKDKEQIFVPLNLYLNSPSIPEKTRKLIYDIGVTVQQVDDSRADTLPSINIYVKAIGDIINEPCFREEVMTKWVKDNLPAPTTAEDFYDETKEGRHTRASTYLKDEYYNLIALTLMMRITLFPFVALIRSMGSIHDDKVRRIKALGYIPEKLKNWEAYKRLQLYVRSFSNKVMVKAEDSLGLMFDDENKEDMLFSIVLFHVLITGKVVNIDENRHIVSLMYNKIAGDNALNAYGKTNINAKHVVDPNEDSNNSVFESYRAVTDRSIAEQTNLAYRGSEEYLARTIGHLVDETEYRLTMASIKNQSLYVNQIHLNLLYVVMRDVIPPLAFSFISKTDIKHILVMASLLIREKHPYLSIILLSNSREDLKTDDSEYYIAPAVLSHSVSADIKEQIGEKYPLENILHPGVINQKVANKLNTHPVVKYVANVSKVCSTETWVVKPDRPWFRNSTMIKDSVVKQQSGVASLVWDLIQDSENIITGLKTLD